MRRVQGLALAAWGFGPEQTPARVVTTATGLRLRSYGGGGAAPVLLVPAPIKRHYIWDLDPRVSVVRDCMANGHAVYLSEWKDDIPDTHGLRLCTAELVRMFDAIRQKSGAPPVVIGHSLGGTLATVAAAQRPDLVGAMVLIEAPLYFGPGTGPLFRLIASLPDGHLLGSARGVPGTCLTAFAAAAAPQTFQFGRLADLLATAADPQAFRRHMRVERWALDEFTMPRRLLDDVLDMLHRRNAFFRSELDLGNGALGPDNVTVPLLSIIDPASEIVPVEAVLPFHRAAATAIKLVLEVRPEPGTGFPHVTALVGPRSHGTLWPRVFRWVAEACPPSAGPAN